MRFWDSSAILPLIVEETASDPAARYYAAYPELVVWWGASVECASALARLERDGTIETRDLTQALQQLQALQSAWNEVQPLDTARAAAQRLLRLHPLRAVDALQLGAALVATDHRPQAWDFVCLDTRLAAAAKRERFGKQLKPFEKFTFIIATNQSNIGSFLNMLIPPAMPASNATSALPVAPLWRPPRPAQGGNKIVKPPYPFRSLQTGQRTLRQRLRPHLQRENDRPSLLQYLRPDARPERCLPNHMYEQLNLNLLPTYPHLLRANPVYRDSERGTCATR